MIFTPISATEIELKYTDTQFPLVFSYIGPNRTHGNMYYNLHWYEIIYNYNITGIICLTDGKEPKSLHVSVFEILEKGKGIGTLAMEYLFDFAKKDYQSITLFAHDERAKAFYLKLGFIEKPPLMIKYVN
jgi:hypothetical protein